jgi:hypothetical protein
MDSVDKRGPGFRKIFDYCYNYKLHWLKRGRETPICDRIIFSKIRAILGGHMKFMLVGGAPLSADTHDFIRTCMGVTVVQVRSFTFASFRRWSSCPLSIWALIAFTLLRAENFKRLAEIPALCVAHTHFYQCIELPLIS